MKKFNLLALIFTLTIMLFSDVAFAQCPAGYPQDCGNDGCAPSSAQCCGNGKYCSAGTSCGVTGCIDNNSGSGSGSGSDSCPSGYPQDCGDGSCAPSGAQCCGGGRHCTAGSTCSSSGCTNTGSGSGSGLGSGSCPSGFPKDCGNDGCAPAGATCCGGGNYCESGSYCDVDGCTLSSLNDSGGGGVIASCPNEAPKDCGNGSCAPFGAQCCSGGGYCDAGLSCTSDGFCSDGSGYSGPAETQGSSGTSVTSSNGFICSRKVMGGEGCNTVSYCLNEDVTESYYEADGLQFRCESPLNVAQCVTQLTNYCAPSSDSGSPSSNSEDDDEMSAFGCSLTAPGQRPSPLGFLFFSLFVLAGIFGLNRRQTSQADAR